MSRALALLCCAALLAGCRGEIAGEPYIAPRSSERQPDGGVAAAGSAATPDVVATTATLESAAQRCDTSRTGPPQLRRLTMRQLDNTVRDLFLVLDKKRFAGFAASDSSSKLGFSNDAALVVSPQTAAAIAEGAESIADLLTDTVIGSLVQCADAPGPGCGKQLIEKQGKRLFRRPLTAAEIERYTALFESIEGASSFANAAKWTLVALIQSPHTLYRRELGDLTADSATLTSYEIATELAYTFGDSTPDDELLALADRDALGDPEVRHAQAKRLLFGARGREGLHQFFREWLRYENVRTADRPSIDGFSDVREALILETYLYLEEVLYRDAAGVRQLLVAPYTFVNAPLAQYYGLSSSEPDFARVRRVYAHGIGILAQGSLLASAANASASSPTQRGLLVQEKFLCRTRPRPPANVPPLNSSDPTSYRTTRQHYEQAHAQGYCKSCHQSFDPIGFGFEHYDQGGRYRQDEGGEPIDATGSMLGRDGNEAFAFDGLAELAEGLSLDDEAIDCISGLLVAYAFGGAGGARCLAEPARQGLHDGEYGFIEMLARLVNEPHFVTRTYENGPAAPEPAPVDAGVPDTGAPEMPQDASVAERRDIGITAQYQANNAIPSDNVIGPFVQLTNVSADTPVALTSLRIRYYFTNEHAQLCPADCRIEGYYAGIHPSGQGVSAQREYVAGADKHAYLEITFAQGSPSLAKGESVEVQQYFHTNPYQDFDERDDYSFDAMFDKFADSTKITVYQGDSLVWGEPPPP